MKKIMGGFITIALITGCLPKIKNEKPVRNVAEILQLEKNCAELRKLGNFIDLSQSIDSDMDQIEVLLNKSDVIKYDKQIDVLKFSVLKSATKLIEIGGSQYATLDQIQKIEWRILNSKDNLDHNQENKVTEVTILQAFDWQGEDKSLAKDIHVDFEEYGARLSLIRPASFVELCQLEKTINIKIAVKFDNESQQIFRLVTIGKK